MTQRTSRDDLLSVREVLTLLGDVSRDTFYEWREKQKAPPCLRLPNGHLRVRRGDLYDWLESLREPADRWAA